MIEFDILTLFPGMFTGPFTESIVKRAQEAGFLKINLHNIRDYATDKHKSVDDYPFGGGAGMVFRPDIVYAALSSVLAPWSAERENVGEVSSTSSDAVSVQERDAERPPVIFLSPDGEVLTQQIAQELASYPRLVLLCGHYEGVDERVRSRCIDREISIGDYVVTGGELAAIVLVDAVSRLRPGVLAAASTAEESHSDSLLEYPQYTRPAVWQEETVPDVLVSGHHGKVATWRHEQRLLRTLQRRPDMLRNANLSDKDRRFLATHGWRDESEQS